MALLDWDITKKINLIIPQQTESLTDFPLLVNLSSFSGVSDFDCTNVFKELSPVSTNDVYFSSVVLAMDMEGTNGSTTFIDKTGKTLSVYGNVQLSTTQFKYGTSSAYFDSSGDYLIFPSDNSLILSADFTIEFWLHPLSLGNQGHILCQQAADFTLQFTSSAPYQLVIWDGTTRYIDVTPINTWTHIAITRSGSTVRAFNNGVLVSSWSNSSSTTYTLSGGYIGSRWGGSNGFYGYIDDLRITKGVARYVSSFTPPLASLITTITNPPTFIDDPNWSKVTLAMPMNGFNGSTVFTDLKSGPISYTGTAQISTTDFKFGSSSFRSTSVSNYLTLPSSAFAFGTSDFTIEFWINLGTNISTSYPYILTTSAYDSGTGFYVTADGASTGWGGIGALHFDGATTLQYGPAIATTSAIRNAGWKHIAISRSGVYTYLFVNGIKEATHTAAGVANYGVTNAYLFRTGTSGYTDSDIGYVDDLQVTKIAKYTTNFTIPTTSVIVKPPNVILPFSDDPYWNQTVLALPMSGTNGSTTFVDLRGKTVTAAGSASISTTQSKFGGSSAYFDGTDDYLSLSTGPDFDFGTGDFTIDVYAYLGSYTGTTDKTLLMKYTSWSTDVDFYLVVKVTTGIIKFGAGDNLPLVLVSNNAISLNTWTHIAVVRNSGVTKLYVDGIAQTSTHTGSVIIPNGSTTLRIGSYNGSSEFWNGYIDDLRVTKGVARYTSNFTPPTKSFQHNDAITPKKLAIDYNDTGKQCFIEIERWDSIKRNAQLWVNVPYIYGPYDASDSYWRNVVLALPMNGTSGSTVFTDLKGNSVTVNGNTQISTAQYKFGGSSAYFDGSGDYLSKSANALFCLGTSPYTIEFWAYNISGVSRCMFELSDISTSYFSHLTIGINAGGYVYFGVRAATGSGNADNYINSTFPINSSWYYIAVCFDGTNSKLYINGILQGTSAFGSYITATPLLGIGAAPNGYAPEYFNGYISDFRITKGVARYTENFTPPTSSIFTPADKPTELDLYYDSTHNDNTYIKEEYWDNVVLALPMNGTNGSTVFNDLKGNTITATGNAIVSSTQHKFGGSSAYFDGSSDRLSTTCSLSGTADFTIELYIYLINGGHGSVYSRILHIGSGNTTGAFNIVCEYNKNPAPVFASIWTPSEVWIGGTPALNNNQWYHIAICRKNNVWYMFYDGIKCSGDINNSMDLSQTNWNFGSNASNAESFYGYIDEVRVTKGFARYTDSFTPPTKSIFQIDEVCDDFTGTDKDLPRNDLWGKIYSTDVAISNNKLRFTGSTYDNIAYMHILSGDFDIQHDFDIVNGPATNSWAIEFIMYAVGSATGDMVSLFRGYEGGTQRYQTARVTNGTWTLIQQVTTAETTGKLRIIRQGSLCSFYSWSGTTWEARGSYTWTTVDVLPVLAKAIWVGTPSPIIDVDNFTVNYAGGLSGYVGDISSYPARNVWGNNYAAVYHLSQNPASTIKDSTGNLRNATSVGSMLSTNVIDSTIGKVITFDGVNDGLDTGFNTNLTNFTLEAIYKTPGIATGRSASLISKCSYFATSATDFPTALYLSDTENVNFGVDTGGDYSWDTNITSPNTYTDTYIHAAATNVSTGAATLYINGTSVATGAGRNPVDNTRNWFIGKASFDNGGGATINQFNGEIRSVRISQVARSEEWLDTSYKSSFDQLVFFSVYKVYINEAYPQNSIKTYGTSQLLLMTATVSGYTQGTLLYDTAFYDSTDTLLLPVISGTNNGSQVSAAIPTISGSDYSWYATVNFPTIFLSYTTPTYSFYTRYLCSGICNYINNPASGILVNLHRRQTGQLIGSTTTAGTGTFEIDSQYNEEHYVVALHPDSTKNALIYDKIIPE